MTEHTEEDLKAIAREELASVILREIHVGLRNGTQPLALVHRIKQHLEAVLKTELMYLDERIEQL